MKKTLSIACAVAGLLAQSALAQITFTATPTSGTVLPGGQFTVTIHLQVTSGPTDVAGYNLWLETAAANSGLFSIVSNTSLVSNWDTRSGSNPAGDVLTTTNSSHTGFAQNSANAILGFVDSGGANEHILSVPTGDVSLETITLMASNSVTVGQTYTFSITNAAMQNVNDPAPRNTGVNESTQSGADFFNATTTGSFSITVIPEPATWSLLGLGGLGSLGLNFLRRRRS